MRFDIRSLQTGRGGGGCYRPPCLSLSWVFPPGLRGTAPLPICERDQGFAAVVLGRAPVQKGAAVGAGRRLRGGLHLKGRSEANLHKYRMLLKMELSAESACIVIRPPMVNGQIAAAPTRRQRYRSIKWIQKLVIRCHESSSANALSTAYGCCKYVVFL